MVEESKSKWHIAGVIGLYWLVSISLVFINKFILSGQRVPVPVFITWVQVGESERERKSGGKAEEDGEDVVGSKPSSFLAGFPRARYDSEAAMKVMPLSAVFVLMIASNQLTLKYVEVSFYNVARSPSIVFNAIFSFIMLGSKVSTRTVGCLVIVIAGFIVGVGGEVKLSVLGVQWGLISSVAVSLNSIYTKKALPYVKNDAWRLAFINNANACLLFIPFVLYYEGSAIMKYRHVLFTSKFLSGLVVSGGLGSMIGIVAVMQIRATSPLTHNISGTAKAGAQTFLAFFIWQNEPTLFACLGIFLVLFGSSMYTYVKITESQGGKEKKAPLLPK